MKNRVNIYDLVEGITFLKYSIDSYTIFYTKCVFIDWNYHITYIVLIMYEYPERLNKQNYIWICIILLLLHFTNTYNKRFY